MNKNGGITLPTGDNAIEDRAWVSGAKWIGASYTLTRKLDSWDYDNQRWTGNWTTTTENASQGDYFLTNPVGKNEDGTAMSTTAAKACLVDAKYSTKTVQIEVFCADLERYRGPILAPASDGWLMDVWFTAREDAFEDRKKIELDKLKRRDGDDLYWGHEFETITQIWNVEDYKMKGQWDDDDWSSLGHDNAIDKEADEYEGLLYWKYQEINETGYTSGYSDYGHDIWHAEEVDRNEIIVFASCTPEIEYSTACEQNQRLSEALHISDDINRTFEDRVKSYKEVEVSSESGMIYLRGTQVPGATETHKVVDEMERVVIHYGEIDYTIQN